MRQHTSSTPLVDRQASGLCSSSLGLTRNRAKLDTDMSSRFFDEPILNSPYASPGRHWELDASDQPTHNIIESRRRADFITPIPKPKKQKSTAKAKQLELVLDEGKGLSTSEQQYEVTATINQIRSLVEKWRSEPDPQKWRVTPENRPGASPVTQCRHLGRDSESSTFRRFG